MTDNQIQDLINEFKGVDIEEDQLMNLSGDELHNLSYEKLLYQVDEFWHKLWVTEVNPEVLRKSLKKSLEND